MQVDLKLIRVGMNMSEATIARWERQPGDAFKKGDALYAIETDKVTQDVLATGDGSCWKSRSPPARSLRWVR